MRSTVTALALALAGLTLAAPQAHGQRVMRFDARPLRAELRGMRDHARSDRMFREETRRNALASARIARAQAEVARARRLRSDFMPPRLRARLLRVRPLRPRHRII